MATLSPGPGPDICNDNHLGLDESVALQHRRGHNLPTVRCRLLNIGQVFYGAEETFSILYLSDNVTLKGLLRLKVMEEDLKVEWVSILIWPLGSSELVATGVRAQATWYIALVITNLRLVLSCKPFW